MHFYLQMNDFLLSKCFLVMTYNLNLHLEALRKKRFLD